MTGQVGGRLAEIRRRWSRDGGMGNERSDEDYSDAGCRILARYAFDDVNAVTDALLAVLALADKWQGWGDRDPDSPVAAVFAGELRRAVAAHLDPGATT